MERGPLFRILKDMSGTEKELDLVVSGQSGHMEIRNVVDVFELHSSQGLQVVTRQNLIWIDASHIAGAYQAREDGG